jgi:dolichol-phosphate mannosyltransferase
MASTSPSPRVIAVIPTYNEAGNIEALVREILALPLPGIGVLVVDDNSPDGTAAIVRAAAAADPRVELLLRTKRRGRGSAGIDGFRAALERGADLVVEMDGDFSHQPRFIPALVAATDGADAAIGSRFVRGGADADRSIVRRGITWAVRRFIRRRFRTPVLDVSSGFRCFTRQSLLGVDVDDLISSGPSIVLEILYKLTLRGAVIREVPIEFIDRKAGRTKLSALTLVETLVMALKFPRLYGPPPAKKRA